MKDHTYVVRATWDEDARVWVAVSEDVPGLVAEASNFEQLVEKLRNLVPELLEANSHLVKREARLPISISLLAEYHERIRPEA
jgi:hypothetical protein